MKHVGHRQASSWRLVQSSTLAFSSRKHLVLILSWIAGLMREFIYGARHSSIILYWLSGIRGKKRPRRLARKMN